MIQTDLGSLIRTRITPKERTLGLVRGHYPFREAHLSRERASSEEQTMSKDKFASVLSPQMEATFIILQIFFETRAFLKFGEFLGLLGNIQSHDAFRPIVRARIFDGL